MKGRTKGKRTGKKRPRCPLCGRAVTKATAWKSNPFFHAACVAEGEAEEGAGQQ